MRSPARNWWPSEGAARTPIRPLGRLIEDVESYLPDNPPTSAATQPVVSLDVRTPLGQVGLFTVIATLGAPLEASAANLAIETFLPMDERRAARRGELSAKGR